MVLASLLTRNAAIESGISGSAELKTSPGVHEEGDLRSPSAKIRANRCRAATPRANGRSPASSLIERASDAVRLKDSKGEAGRRAVSRTATTLTVLLILLVGTAASASAQSGGEDESVTLIDSTVHFSEPHPVFIRIWCMKASCPGLELEVNTPQGNYSVEDPLRVELSFDASGNVTFRLTADQGTGQSDLWFEMSTPDINNALMKEEADWLDNVPSPGIAVNQEIVDSTWNCPIDDCQSAPIFRSHWIVGSLENGSDKDSIEIHGQAGDFIIIPWPLMPESAELEFWLRNDSTKTLLDPFEADEDGWFRFEYPEDGNLWLRIKQDSDAGFAAYELYVMRRAATLEASWGELSNPWGEENALPFPDSNTDGFDGWISPSDDEGDAVRVEVVGRMSIFLNCWSDDDSVTFEVLVIDSEGLATTLENEADDCPDHFDTPAGTSALEFRMTSDSLTSWSVQMNEYPAGDAGQMGDAPDRLWTDSDDLSLWPSLGFDENIDARMSDDEYVDVFAFEVTEENGSRLYADADTSQPVRYQILVLDQTTWAILNSSTGGLIDVPPGTHAIRVEKLGEASLTYYDFTLVNAGEITEPELPDFVDQSELFTEYYVFAGAFLIAPALLVIFWNRKRWSSGISDIEIEAHERRRLRRLRERLTSLLEAEEIDEQVIDSALHQLGDSPWQAVVADWGEPLLRHNTEQVEICAWRISEGDATMLLGIRIANSPWELAAMRVYAPEGAIVSIGAVSPQHLFQGDEIFLDTLQSGSRTFLRLTLEGEPSNIGFHLSGLVDDEPLAAVPNRALEWS